MKRKDTMQEFDARIFDAWLPRLAEKFRKLNHKQRQAILALLKALEG